MQLLLTQPNQKFEGGVLEGSEPIRGGENAQGLDGGANTTLMEGLIWACQVHPTKLRHHLIDPGCQAQPRIP